jgi:RimJ/RimL family protein N-acetyltransferase
VPFFIRPLQQSDAEAIAAWHYPAPYDFYDMSSDPEDLAELMDPAARGDIYWAADDESGRLAGFFGFRLDDALVEVGLGLRPDLTGRGMGRAFVEAGLAFARERWHPSAFGLAVAAFNMRAIQVYERAGFRQIGPYWQETNGGRHLFVAMARYEIALDHVVYAVPDLDEAAALFGPGSVGWGLHVVPGGSHPNWGTRNSLCHFGLPYVEFIAVADPAVAQQSGFGRAVAAGAARGGGPVLFALGVPDLDAAVARLRRAGVAVEGPQEGRRVRPDGSVVAWRLAFPAADGDLPMPFLIQWALDDEARQADLSARGVIAPHPAGAGLALEGLVVPVPDLNRAVEAYSRYYGLEAGEPYVDDSLGGAHCAVIPLKRGSITLCEAASGPFVLQVGGAAESAERQAPGAVWRFRAGSATRWRG